MKLFWIALLWIVHPFESSLTFEFDDDWITGTKKMKGLDTEIIFICSDATQDNVDVPEAKEWKRRAFCFQRSNFDSLTMQHIFQSPTPCQITALTMSTSESTKLWPVRSFAPQKEHPPVDAPQSGAEAWQLARLARWANQQPSCSKILTMICFQMITVFCLFQQSTSFEAAWTVNASVVQQIHHLVNMWLSTEHTIHFCNESVQCHIQLLMWTLIALKNWNWARDSFFVNLTLFVEIVKHSTALLTDSTQWHTHAPIAQIWSEAHKSDKSTCLSDKSAMLQKSICARKKWLSSALMHSQGQKFWICTDTISF